MRRIFTGCILAALLVSCSGEDDSITFENASKEVGTIYDLGKCTDSRKGEVVFVIDEDEDYFCFSGKWIPESGLDASSAEESSSSAKDEPGSSANEEQKSSSSSEDSSSDKASSSASSSSAGSSAASSSSAGSSSSGDSKSSSSAQSSSSAPAGSDNVFVDPRDGTSYKLTTIGSQTWFAENMNYQGKDVTGYCHSDKPENCDKYGKLYDWDAAKKACPTGTHLPTIEELQELMDFVGKDSSAVVLMADTGWTRDDGYVGIDKYGFAMLPGSFKGGRSYGSTLGWSGQMWTASDSAGLVYAVYFGWNLPYISIGVYDLADGWGMSVRCLKGNAKSSSSAGGKSSSSMQSSSSAPVSSSRPVSSSAPVSSSRPVSSSAPASSSRPVSSSAPVSSSRPVSSSAPVSSSTPSSSSIPASSASKSSWQFLNPAISYGQMTDSRDGQVYKTIVIEGLTWMAENLNYETDDSFCYNDSAKYCATYGRLYKWSAAMNACPEGWHLTTYDDAYTLTGPNLQCYTKSADELRSMEGWIPLNGDDTRGLDAYGFSASPGGRRESSGQYVALGTEAGYWFMIEASDNTIYDWVMEIRQDSRDSKLNREYEARAHSVRCVKGAPGSY